MDQVTKAMWRLRLNWTLSSFILAVLYVSGIKDQFSSLHRFVTNPISESLNKTDQIDDIAAGLGESELFYSFVMASIHFGAIFGALLMGVLVKFLPYWYLFVSSLCSFVLGSILYAVSYVGWLLIIAEFFVGFFKGAAITLSYSYAIDSSIKYYELEQERALNAETEDEYKGVKQKVKDSHKLRDLLFAIEGIGRGAGYIIGPATSVIFSYLYIDHFRSIGWFNTTLGLVVLILFVFLFNGESNCRRKCRQVHCDIRKSTCPSVNKTCILIIISMHLLTYLVSILWGYFETLIPPIVSDSFGFNINLLAYLYLGFSIPKIAGSSLVILLQWMKRSTQLIGIVGISVTICGYLVLTDWQTIPYDPCTEFSPFHHPDIVLNLTNASHLTETRVQDESVPTNDLYLYGSLKLNFDDGYMQSVRLPFGVHGYCSRTSRCDCGLIRENGHICLTYMLDRSMKPKLVDSDGVLEGSQIFECSLLSKGTICVKTSDSGLVDPLHAQRDSGLVDPLHTQLDSGIQSIRVLTDHQLNKASNMCMKADIPNHVCHWIPFKTKKLCNDCPPICRSTSKTISLAQIIVGSSILLIGYSLVWITTLAISSNLTPKNYQGLIIGTLNTVGTLSEATSPIFLDAVYEGMKKRLFPATITIAVLNVPFLMELVLLHYWRIGSDDWENKEIQTTCLSTKSD